MSSQLRPDTDVELLEEHETRLDEPWKLILFNDDVHTFDEVIFQLIKAVNVDREQAEAWAWEVHLRGKACVLSATFEECFRANLILLEIQLITQIEG
jgi:ATP-dependent Clp protease adapter protein ClpS